MTEKKTKRVAKPKSCLECGSENLFAQVTITRMMPLVLRGGSVKSAGIKATQLEFRDEFIKTPDGRDKKHRGPVFCMDCGAEHFLVVPSPNLLRLGSVTQAIVDGVE